MHACSGRADEADENLRCRRALRGSPRVGLRAFAGGYSGHAVAVEVLCGWRAGGDVRGERGTRRRFSKRRRRVDDELGDVQQHARIRIDPQRLQPVAHRALVGAGLIRWRAYPGLSPVMMMPGHRQTEVRRVAGPGRTKDDERDQHHGKGP